MRRRVRSILTRVIVCLLIGATATVAIAWSVAYWVDVDGWVMARNDVSTDTLVPIPPKGWGVRATGWRDDARNIRCACRWLEDEGLDLEGYVCVEHIFLPGVQTVTLGAGDFYSGPDTECSDESPLEILPRWCDDYLRRIVNAMAERDKEIIRVQAVGWPLPALWCAPAVAFPSGVGIYAIGGVGLSQHAVGGIPLGDEPHPYWHSFRIPTLPYRPIWRGLIADILFFSAIAWIVMMSFTQGRRYLRRNRGRCIKCGYDLRGVASARCPECGRERSTIREAKQEAAA
jgi:hypothetical protein